MTLTWKDATLQRRTDYINGYYKLHRKTRHLFLVSAVKNKSGDAGWNSLRGLNQLFHMPEKIAYPDREIVMMKF